MNHSFLRINRVRKHHHVSEAEGFNGWPSLFLILFATILFILGFAGACREFF